jgi:hypothetical protein
MMKNREVDNNTIGDEEVEEIKYCSHFYNSHSTVLSYDHSFSGINSVEDH